MTEQRLKCEAIDGSRAKPLIFSAVFERVKEYARLFSRCSPRLAGLEQQKTRFVDPASHTKVLAFLFLGAVFIFNSTIYCSVIAWFASAIGRRLREGSSMGSLLKRATGARFVGLGLKLAVSK